MRNIKHQLHTRTYFARQFLLLEMRLSKYYKQELVNPTAALYPEEREYKKRIVGAVERLQKYLQNCPDNKTRIKFFDTVMLRGDSDVQAVCDELHISRGTYYHWRISIINLYGTYMGIYI
jgi:hypothetical protein